MKVHGVELSTLMEMEQSGAEPWCAPGPLLQSGGLLRTSKRLATEYGIHTRLVGDMGDEVFCGDHFPPVYLGDYLRERRVKKWASSLHTTLQKGERSLWNLLWVCSAGSLAAAPDQYRGDAGAPLWLADSVRAEFSDLVHARRLGGDRCFPGSAAREYHFRSIDRSARRVAGASFGLSQRLRAPYSHRPLIEFVLSIPWEHKISAFEDRIVMRRGLKGILPEAVRTRRDKGRGRGNEQLILDINRDHLRTLSSGRCVSELGLIDRQKFQEASAQFLSGFTAPGTRRFLMSTFTLEAWLLAGGPAAARRFPADELSFVDVLRSEN
jgi:asparagine synthetase B (glutamine-hydrolysing)